MATPKSVLRHRPIGGDRSLTVPITQRRSRTTATPQRQPSVRQEEPYEAETIELVDEVEEVDEYEEVETGQLGSQEVHHPAPQTRQLRARITEEPITRRGSTPTRSVALRGSDTRATGRGLVDIRWVVCFFVCSFLLLLVLNLVVVTVRNFANTQYLAATTGITPTAQLDATLRGHQIHFIAMVLHQHLGVIALDETDPSHPSAQLYPNTNPMLLSDQSGPVTLSLEVRDVNGDGKPDLVIIATAASVNFFWQPAITTTVLLNSDGLRFKPL